MIPNIAHFICLRDKQQHEDFLFVYYVAVLSCKLIQKPKKIFFYCDDLPKGVWWEKTKDLVEIVNVSAPEKIGGKIIKKIPHKADILKMSALHHGGIYLDLDTITVRNYENLLDQSNFVISQEITECGRNMGFSNAIMMSSSKSKFLNIWANNYEKFFNPDGWQEASTILPQMIYSKINSKEDISLLPPDCFVRPSFRKLENIFEDEFEIPRNLLVLHLWNQYSKNKYLNNIKDFSWAIKNSHTLYGKLIIRLIDLL